MTDRARPCVLVSLARRRRDVADAELGDPGDVRLLRGAPHRIAVPLAHTMPHIDEIEMRIDLHDMDRLFVAEGADARDVDRVVTAEHHRQCLPLQNLPHRHLGVLVAGVGVGVNHVGIADVDDPHLVHRQIDGIVLMVVGAAVAEGEER